MRLGLGYISAIYLAQVWPDADALLANLKERLRAHLEVAPRSRRDRAEIARPRCATSTQEMTGDDGR